MKLTMENEQCHLLGGVFSTLVQAVLAFLCVVALVVKRHNEVPQRDWYVWFLDVMKQAIGSSYGHFTNIFLSVFIAANITDADECQWYCLTYIADSTFGTFFNLTFLKLFEYFMQRCFPKSTIMNFGDYGNPPQLFIWFPQLFVWITIVTVAKICTLLIIYRFILPLDVILTFLFQIFVGQPELELIVVMIIIPTMLNTVQFWITDTFLMKQNSEEDCQGDSELGEELMAGDIDMTQHGDDDNNAPFTSLSLHTNNLITGTTSHHHKNHKGAYRSLNANIHSGSECDLSGIQMSEGSHSPSYHRSLHDNPGSSMNTIGSSLLSYIPSIWGNKNTKIERSSSEERLHTVHNRAHSPISPGKSVSTYLTVHNEGIHSVNTKSYTPHKAAQNITKRGQTHQNVSSNSLDPEDMYL